MCFDKRVEGVEKFFLGAVLAAKKLDVIYQQKIKGVIVSFKLVECFMLVSPYYVGNVLFCVDISDFGSAVVLQHLFPIA